MIRPPSPLQVKQQALADLLADSRDDLAPAEYLVLLAFAVDVVAREVARTSRWDGRESAA